MPPSPVYNWLCVLHTTTEILSNIARYKAAQVTPGYVAIQGPKRRRVEPVPPLGGKAEDMKCTVDLPRVIRVERIEENVQTLVPSCAPPVGLGEEATKIPRPSSPDVEELIPIFKAIPSEPTPESSVIQQAMIATASSPLAEPPFTELAAETIASPPPAVPISPYTRNLQSSKVPSSRIGRLFHYGGLAASLGYGAASEFLRRTGSSSEGTQGSLIMTEANIRRLVSKLSQMRGAALKLGQFLSIQDSHLLPPDVDAIFRRVQNSAHYMPDSQLNQTLSSELGANWESEYFESFDHIPFAAASIGQVHSAELLPASTSTFPFPFPSPFSSTPIPVAVKVQFPNIRHSIDSDLSYVRLLLTASKILPRGMFLDKTIEVMKNELADECSYVREASFLRRFASEEFLGGDKRFKVPWVWEGSTEGVLVMERMEGVSVGEAQRLELSKRDRDDIAERIVELCLRELFEFRTMQTDPNWTNFLWNSNTRQIELVDFGATRIYSKEFMDKWLRLLTAAIEDDYDGCVEWSLKLGYLIGGESDAMLKAHTRSISLLAMPFKHSTAQPFSFSPASEWGDATNEIRDLIPTMLHDRLTPPPRETYSLNRKLSGAFLLASRLGAEFDARRVWEKVVGGYKFGDE